jgi:phospholipid/cholesterol/gamma-HCH transport system substrate-binding protein
MKSKRTELIVGIFSLCAIVILIAGLIFLKEFRFNRHRQHIVVLFDNASGLKDGDPVMVAGVRKGSVQSISLQGGGVRIELALDIEVQMSDDASFIITSSGLVGLKYVEIDPGQSGRPLDISQPIQGTHQSDAFDTWWIRLTGA